MVTMDNNVVTETSPTDTSTSLPYFAANIESIAATGAEAEAVIAIAIVGLSPHPFAATNAPRTMEGIAKRRNTEATRAGAQRK